MSRENLLPLKPGIIASSVAILLLSVVAVFAGLPDYASSPADTAPVEEKGGGGETTETSVSHQVYLPLVLRNHRSSDPTPTPTDTSTPTATSTPRPEILDISGVTLSYEVDGQTIQRAIVVQDLGGTYSFDATGGDGDIPYGITSTLTVTGIQTNVDLTDILVEGQQGIEAQVTDACDPDENPCDISLSLNPTHQPESPIDDSVPYSFSISLVAYEGQIQLSGVEGEVFNPFELKELGLPIDLDQVAGILRSDECYMFNYMDTTKLDTSCSTGTHLGDVMEIYSDFEEGDPDPIPAPSYDVFAPIDLEPYGIQGDADRRVVFYTYLGYNALKEPIFYSFIHVVQLEESMRQRLANELGVDPSALFIDYDDPNSQIDEYSFYQPSKIEKGALIGYMQNPWDWGPQSGPHHALGLHINLTKNSRTDNLRPIEDSMPELTPYYLNWVIQELVLDRGLTIGIEYFGEDFCASPERIRELMLEHIRREVLEQIDLYQWPERPQHFDVSRAND